MRPCEPLPAAITPPRLSGARFPGAAQGWIIRRVPRCAGTVIGLLCAMLLLVACDQRQRNQAKIERIERQWQDELAELARARGECDEMALRLPDTPDRKVDLAICRETVRIRALTTHNIREAMDRRIAELRAAQR